ncbi:hypothetical protein Dimus_013114 [Dionaea muscipula]
MQVSEEKMRERVHIRTLLRLVALGTTHFAAVHKVFSISNASKLLQGIPVHQRLRRRPHTLLVRPRLVVRDPVYGRVAHIFSLQQTTCHSLRVMPRDLKPENLLLVNKDDDFPPNVIDFGLSV